jgi:hypothetical protein
MSRCVNNCLAGGAGYQGVTGGWGDTRSFIQPFDLFHGGIRVATTVRRPVFRAAAVTSTTGRPGSGRRLPAATPR